jgi:hypothetical protein
MTPTGKIPSTEDPRIQGAGEEVANIGINTALALAPLPGASVGLGGARFVPGLLRRLAPEAEALASTESLASRSARLYNPPDKPQLPITAQYPRGVPQDCA